MWLFQHISVTHSGLGLPNFASTFFSNPPPFVEQLISEASLRKTGYFEPERVWHFRDIYNHYGAAAPGKKLVAEMGLTGVMATQLWHHTFLGGGLCDLPTWSPTAVLNRRNNLVGREVLMRGRRIASEDEP